MSSAFDSEVYAERNRLPGVSIGLQKLMQSILWNGKQEPVSLTLEYRPDVDTSQWWTLRWGEGRFAAAKELELCLFRAAVSARNEDERAKKYAGIPTEPEGKKP